MKKIFIKIFEIIKNFKKVLNKTKTKKQKMATLETFWRHSKIFEDLESNFDEIRANFRIKKNLPLKDRTKNMFHVPL